MKPEPTRHILSAEKLDRGVLVAFDSGECALYSESLLSAMLPNAEAVISEPEEDSLQTCFQ